MSSESFQHQHQQQQQQSPPLLSPNECFRILERIFEPERSSQSIDAIFKLFESSFKSHPNLVGTIIDFYFDYSNKLTSLNEPAANINLKICQSKTKTIVDLIFTIPDDLASKVFDRIADKLNSSPTSSSQASASLNLTINAQHTWLKAFERALTLLRLIAYNKKSWLPKLQIHNLFPTVFKLIKINSNLNDQIIVEASLFYVALISVVPLQIFNSHLDSIFQVFICLLKHYTYLEQKEVFTDGITWRCVKWSIRLLFYACYGLFPTQFIQNLRKKDHYLINKEFIRSTTFYLRFHPSLMREKNDSNEKQLKQTAPNCDDYSLEWRQYCLDSLCTNYNQIIYDLGSYSACSSLHGVSNQFSTIKLSHALSNRNSKTPIELDASPQILGSQSLLSNNLSFPSSMSPSSIIPNSSQRVSDLDSSLSKKLTNTSYANQGSIPTTPNILNSSNTGFFQYPPSQQTEKKNEFLSNQSNQPNNSSIKNLTLQFMVNDTETISDWMTCEKFSKFVASAEQQAAKQHVPKRRSNSDSSMLISYKNMIADKPHFANNHEQELSANKLMKSEMRDINPSDLMSEELSSHASLATQPSVSDARKTLNDLSSFVSDSSSFTPINNNRRDSNEILANYLKTLQQNKTSLEVSPNQEITRLKQDLNHLAIQLVYERHLRNKYEEDSNRLYFIKIQCDQLKEEKNYLEKNLKELVEQYRREVEDSLYKQTKVELDAYQSDINQRDETIENIQQKLTTSELMVNELKEKFESTKEENKRLENENGKLMQLLEREKNLQAKNEIDQVYLKSLKYTTDMLRKKLLILSKSQQELYQGFSNELVELNQLYNSPLFNAITQKDKERIASTGDSLKGVEQIEGTHTASSILLTPLYQFQQTTIDTLQQEIEELRLANKNLQLKFDENLMELDACKNDLSLKEKKIDDLNETLNIEVVDMMAEMLKNNNRVQNSLMNVNKRLEEEIFKLKADLAEQRVVNKNLSEKFEYLETHGYRILRDCQGNPVGPSSKKLASLPSKSSNDNSHDS